MGYGTENGEDYWIAKNSYSDKWGDNGYIRIKRKLSTCKFVLMDNLQVLLIINDFS